MGLRGLSETGGEDKQQAAACWLFVSGSNSRCALCFCLLFLILLFDFASIFLPVSYVSLLIPDLYPPQTSLPGALRRTRLSGPPWVSKQARGRVRALHTNRHASLPRALRRTRLSGPPWVPKQARGRARALPRPPRRQFEAPWAGEGTPPPPDTRHHASFPGASRRTRLSGPPWVPKQARGRARALFRPPRRQVEASRGPRGTTRTRGRKNARTGSPRRTRWRSGLPPSRRNTSKCARWPLLLSRRRRSKKWSVSWWGKSRQRPVRLSDRKGAAGSRVLRQKPKKWRIVFDIFCFWCLASDYFVSSPERPAVPRMVVEAPLRRRGTTHTRDRNDGRGGSWDRTGGRSRPPSSQHSRHTCAP